MVETLSEALLREKWLEIIRLLLDNPGEMYSQNELAEETGISYKTVQNVVQTLDGFGIIRIEEQGPSHMVSLNQDSPYVDVLEELGDLDARPLKETAKEYADELRQRPDADIDAAILFGSVARGLPTSQSDIDILILAGDEDAVEEMNREAQSLADKYQRKQDVTISPLVMSEDRFRRELKSEAPLETRIKEEGEPLIGELPDG